MSIYKYLRGASRKPYAGTKDKKGLSCHGAYILEVAMHDKSLSKKTVDFIELSVRKKTVEEGHKAKDISMDIMSTWMVFTTRGLYGGV